MMLESLLIPARKHVILKQQVVKHVFLQHYILRS